MAESKTTKQRRIAIVRETLAVLVSKATNFTDDDHVLVTAAEKALIGLEMDND